MCAIVLSEEEQDQGVVINQELNSLTSETESTTTTTLNSASSGAVGNHQARTRKRWSSNSGESRPQVKAPLTKDCVHESFVGNYISPAQLYSTDSGWLFHAGQILVVLVGLPATSKTLTSVAITRYTRWFGVKTKSFHMSVYRKEVAPGGLKQVPMDYFSAKPTTADGVSFRKNITKKMLDGMIKFFREDKGQLAIYDALNIMRSERKEIADQFRALGIKVLFIESVITDQELFERNVEMAAASSDYLGWEKKDAVDNYRKRLELNKPIYQSMSQDEGLSYVKYINFGEKLVVNENHHGFLINKIVFFLMNLRYKKGCVYFARCGTSDRDKYIDDEVLNDEGIEYSMLLTETVLDRINKRRMEANEGIPVDTVGTAASMSSLSPDSPCPLLSTVATLRRTASIGDTNQRQYAASDGSDEDSFVVWTAPRKRTYDTAMFFVEKGINVRQRTQLQQLHPGVVADLTENEIRERFPSEYEEYEKDKYHYRFPRAESYHDLAVRIEPLLLEMERMCGDILIIGHESTLRVLYGYLAACPSHEIPSLSFTREELIEISFSPFKNNISRIPLMVNKERK